MNDYISYIVLNGINVKKNQPVEILCSYYLKEFIKKLEEECYKNNSGHVYIKYIDGPELINKINYGYDKYIKDDINYYKELINNNFCRIVVKSPFLFPLVISKDKRLIYQEEITKLSFVNDYFLNNNSQRTICSAPNVYWAAKLNITIEELTNLIIKYALIDINIDEYKDKLSKENIEKFIIKSKKINLEIMLTSNFEFAGKYQYTKDSVKFQPNIPSLEIFTAPKKFGVNGVLHSSKPLYYNGKVINEYSITFKNGKVVDSFGLDDFINKEGLDYLGEVAITLNNDSNYYFCPLLDENTCCHIALGCAYEYGIKDINSINKSNYHVDIPLGNDVDIIGVTKDRYIPIVKKGIFIYEK